MKHFLRVLLLAWLGLAAHLPQARAGGDTFYLGNGQNGALTISTSGTVINTYAPVTAPLAPGDTQLNIGTATGTGSFAANSLVLIWQATGLVPEPVSGGTSPVDLTGGSVGRWELARLSGISGNTLTLTAPLRYSYAANVTQVVRVPEYTTVTIGATRSITAPAWNGSTGGIVAFLATGTVTNNSSPGITVTGKGFRGGLFVDDNSGTTGASGLDEAGPVGAQKGEGVAATRYGTTQTGRGRVANAGGGGVALAAGGGGGGNGGAGGQGGNTDLNLDGNRAVGGQGGTAVTYSALSSLLMGGGGGAGHGSSSSGTTGGAGGGVIFVRCASLAGAGSMTANGTAGGSTLAQDGASGGGGGGLVYLRVAGSAAAGLLQAIGGTGGSCNGGVSVGPGGGGGGGRILLQKASGTAATTASSIIGASAGVQQDSNAPGGSTYGAQNGGSGSATTLTTGFPQLSAPTVTTPANGAQTNNQRPTYSGTTPTTNAAGSQVELLVDGTSVAVVTADASGNWTFTPASNLAAGQHTLVARFINTAQGVESPSSNTNTFTIDTTPPPAPVVVTPANGAATNTVRPVYSGTAEANSTVTVYVDGTSIGTATAGAGGSWIFTQPTNLAEGSHPVRTTATDAAGNVSVSSSTNTFVVDVTAPTVAISSSVGPLGSSTATTPIPFTVTFSESVTGFTISWLTVSNGTASNFAGSGSTYTFSVMPSAAGTVTVNVAAGVAQDAAGNQNTAATAFSLQYASAPTISGFSPNPAGAGIPVTLTGTNLSGASALTINGAVATILSNSGSSLTFSVPAGATASGSSTVTVGGNTASSSAFSFLPAPGNALAFDGVNDYVDFGTFAARPSGNADFTYEAWYYNPGGQTSDRWLSWWGTAAANQAVIIGYDGPTGNVKVHHFATGNDFTSSVALPVGRWSHLAVVWRGAAQQTDIYLDGTLRQTLTYPAPLAVPASGSLQVGTFASNNLYCINGRLDEVRLYSGALTAANIQADMLSPTASVPANLKLYLNFDEGTPDGVNTGLTSLYDVSSTGATGTLNGFTNLGTANTSSNWVESYALVVPTATAATGVGSGGFTANWTAPAVGTITNYLLDVSTSSTFASLVSGAPFTVAAGLGSRAFTGLTPGTTYYYRLRADKTSVTGQGAYSGTIAVPLPCAAPVALTQNVTVALNSNGTATVTAAQVNNGSTADCAAATNLQLSKTSFSCADLGPNTVTLTVTDASNRTATATATVTVQDNQAPGAGVALPAAPALATSNVPEASNYGVVYQLDMTNVASFNGQSAVPYTVNNSALSVANPSRVAYFMELQSGGVTKWVWASMDNFAANLTQLGLPHPTSNNVSWHQNVSNLNVYASSGAGVVTGASVGTGRVEMWPSNYAQANADNVPGASNSTFDFGDQPTAGNYGSFQLHNVTTAQTVFAYNNWGSNGDGGGIGDLGIGNQGSGNPDWTFSYNATSYSVKRLYILVLNPASFVQPATLTLNGAGTATLAQSQVYTGATDNCGIRSVTVTPSSFTCANVGTNTVTVTVTDNNGNASTQQATVTVTVPPTTTTTWTGAASILPTDCANWSYGKTPDATTSVIIPAGLSRYPVLSSGTLAVKDFSVASGAAFVLNSGATLQVNGDWTSDGTATLSGTVTFVGSAATQALGGSVAPTFASLTVNKASGTVQLSQAIAVSGSLTLSSGTLTTGGNPVTLGSATTLSETATSYVLGRVTTTRPVPAGAAQSFGGLGLTLTPAVASTAPGSTQVTRVTGTALSGQGTSTSIKRYYDIQPTVNSGLNVTVQLGYLDAELNGISESDLGIFRSTTGTAGPWQPVAFASQNTTANTITATGVDHFSVWTIGARSNPLPVQLVSFTTERQGEAALLRWTTAQEKDNAYFAVESSADGREFREIARRPGAGTSTTRHDYQLTDAGLSRYAAPLVYYRLRQVDTDGTAIFSDVRTVRVEAAAPQLFPNPARATATLTGATPGAPVQLLDALGRQVATATADASGTAKLPLRGLPAGVYGVRLGRQVLRLVVE